MNLLHALLQRRRLIIATALLLALAGLIAWYTMPREEDPQFPKRIALVIIAFPGADTETVERLVVEPVEEHLAEVEEIQDMMSTARAGVAIFDIDLDDSIYDTDSSWDEVREALDRARTDFPAGVAEPIVKDDLTDAEAVVLAFTGHPDPLVLADAAERVKRALLALESVRKVNLVADPEEQITIAYDDTIARRLGLDPRQLGLQLGQRSLVIPGGSIRLGTKSATLRPQTEFRSVEEIASTPILLPSGSSVPLETLAEVRRGPREPAEELMRYRGEPAVGVGVVPIDDRDRIAFGRDVRRVITELAPELAPIEITEVAFQPDLVETRLGELSRSLMIGILIVAAVLFATMGLRMGLLVVFVLPLVTFASLAIFAMNGGILHQISIAALVIALGMLVDNAIVVAENMQYRIDRGEPIREASLHTIRELAIPLGTATGTTLAAFVPMYVSVGPTADFTRAIPTLIMLTLTVSYVFAILVTPVLGELLLRTRKPSAHTSDAPAEDESEESRPKRAWASRLAAIAVGKPRWVLVGAALLLALTLAAAAGLEQRFFPYGDRALTVIDLELAEGSHLRASSAAATQLERALERHPDTGAITTFVGRSAPRFYYNLSSRPSSPHLAQLMVETTSLDAVERVMAAARDYVRREMSGVAVVARRLEQGPPIEAPIDLRLFGDDLNDLETAADAVLAELRAIPGTTDVRHSMGLGVPTVEVEIDDAAAGRHGVSRADVALALYGRTLGSEIGQYRVGEDPVPILVRSRDGEDYPVDQLASLDITRPGGEPVPLAQIADTSIAWRPAAIYHNNGRREVRVQSQLDQGATFTQVLDALQPRLDALELPTGVAYAFEGAAAESGKANAAILSALPLGTMLLLFFLLAEFNSFRRVMIILATVPLAAIGVVPGLLLAGQPFGFMSLLGVFSLVGIVVNNAIVLLDRVERRRSEGATIDEALTDAVERRTRPILLTMVTTIAGLSPLAFSETSLWPPLAWAMISGLAASTVLTLVVIPALYKVLFTLGKSDWMRGRLRPVAAAGTVLLLVLGAPGVHGAEKGSPSEAVGVSVAETKTEALSLTLDDVLARAITQPSALAADARTQAAEAQAVATRRTGRLPTVGVSAQAVWRDRTTEIRTPFGDISLSEADSQSLAIEVVQPLIDIAQRRYLTPAAEADAAASAAQTARLHRALASRAADTYVTLLAIDARTRSTTSFVESLGRRLAETEARVTAGRTLEADALRLRLDLEAAQLDLTTLGLERPVAARELGRLVGSPGPVEPDWDGDYERGTVPAAEALIEQATKRRHDLVALDRQIEALNLRAAAVRASRLPRLEARGTWIRSDGDPFLPSSLAQGSLNIVWRPFAAATRAPRATALEAQRTALEHERDALAQAVASDVRSALARLETSRAAIPVRTRGIELATETLRVEHARHAAGRATTNDLLDAESRLRSQRTALDLSKLEILRAWIRLELTTGGRVE